MSQDPNYSTSDGRQVYTEGENPPNPDLQTHMEDPGEPNYDGPSVRAATPDDQEGIDAYQRGQERIEDIHHVLNDHDDPHAPEPETPEVEPGPAEALDFSPGLDSLGGGLDSLSGGLDSLGGGLDSLDPGMDSLGSGADGSDPGYASDDSGYAADDSGYTSDDSGQDSAYADMDSAGQDYDS